MISFTGRSAHKTLIRNKPIPEGFKVWALGFQGFIHDWLWHSRRDGVEECPRTLKVEEVPYLKEVMVAPTHLVPINLCRKLRDRNPHTNYVVILDNLFLNVPVAHILLKYDIGCLGTTRKNTEGFPRVLIDAKNHNRLLQWGEHVSIQVGKALCFLWQDNNAVLGVTTTFSMHRDTDFVVRSRKRPKKTSTNAAVTWPVFQGHARKDLAIPTLIDVYNHHMNGVDLANQIRRSFTCQRPQQLRWWRPITFWLFDICANNSFLIWERFTSKSKAKSRRKHKQFQEILIRSLISMDSKLPVYDIASDHAPASIKERRHCAWGARCPTECYQGVGLHRKVLGEVVNEARPKRRRARQVHTICVACDVSLCYDRDCFNKWHAFLHSNC